MRCSFYWPIAFLLGILALGTGCDDSTPVSGGADADSVCSQGPCLYIPEPVFDFGITPQRSVVSHTFRLYSAGTDTLRILSVKPG